MGKKLKQAWPIAETRIENGVTITTYAPGPDKGKPGRLAKRSEIKALPWAVQVAIIRSQYHKSRFDLPTLIHA